MKTRTEWFTPVVLSGRRSAFVGVAAGAMLVLSGLPVVAQAQQREDGAVPVRVEDPGSPESKRKAAANRERIALERELNKLRVTYFRSAKNVELRRTGLEKLRAYTAPEQYPSLVKVFARSDGDVQMTITDMLAAQRTPEGDATLAWIATMVDEPGFRAYGRDRLALRVSELEGEVPQTATTVIEMAIRSPNPQHVLSGAQLADKFNIVAMIPHLINAQFQGQRAGGRSESERTGDLAWIAIGQQVAFVSDLTPIVSDSAVAFDPTIGVINTGSLIRIQDAVVTTYRTEILPSLVGLSSRAWGASTAPLGDDQLAWQRWYTEQYLPMVERLAVEDAMQDRPAETSEPRRPQEAPQIGPKVAPPEGG